MIRDEKPMLSTENLIQRMEEQGVLFNIETKDDAKQYLEEHNYYFKVMAYRENYHKNTAGPGEGKYIKMEFAYLHELADIDRDLRYLTILMALDIEHYLKVKLLNDMSNNPKEDGYEIVRRFIDAEKSASITNTSKARNAIESHRTSNYCKDLIDKYCDEFSAWALVELVPFGELLSFYDFYYQTYGQRNKWKVLLNSVRDIRNVAAHSNCLINKLAPTRQRPNNDVIKRVKEIPTLGAVTIDKKLHNVCLYDLTALLFAYDEIVVDSNTRKTRLTQLSDLVHNRMLIHKDWFIENAAVSSAYKYFREVVDYIVHDVV